MRTTIDINDELFQAAKAYAARRKLTMRRLVEQALRDVLDEAPSKPLPSAALPSFGGRGLRPGIDLTDNSALLEAMDAES